MRFLLVILWFVFLPLIFYMLYVAWAKGRARRLGNPSPKLFDGPWLWAVGASVVLGIVGFLVLGLSQQPGDHDEPTALEREKL